MRAERPFWKRFLLPTFAVLAAANLVLLASWTLPRGLRQRSARARFESARKELDVQRELFSKLRARSEAIKANVADRQAFHEKLAGTEETDLLPVHEAVESMARSVGLRPGGRSVARHAVEESSLERVAIVLPLSGSYDQLVGFLREVESSPRFITLDRVSMQGEPGNARLQVELSTYMRLRQDPEEGSASGG